MTNYDKDTRVTFHHNIGIVGANRQESFTLGQLDYDPDIDGTSKEEVEAFLKMAFDTWEEQFLDAGWYFE